MDIKKSLVFLLTFIFLISITSALGCDLQGWKGYSQLYQNKTIIITCPTCTFINFSAVKPNGAEFLTNVQMQGSSNTFSYTFLGEDLDKVGTYTIDGFSNLDEPLALCFDVNPTGGPSNPSPFIAILVFHLLIGILLIWFNVKNNSEVRERMFKKLVLNYVESKEYGTGLGKAIMFGLAYGLLKIMFVYYYLWVVIFLAILVQFVDMFNITNLSVLLTTLLNISLYGFIGVFIIAAFMFYDLLINTMRSVADNMRGIADDIK